MNDEQKKGLGAVGVLALLLLAFAFYSPGAAGMSWLFGLAAIWLTWRIIKMPKKPPSPFGSASWATLAEIDRFNRRRGAETGLGTVITPGKGDDWTLHDDYREQGPLRWQTDKHVMMIGTTRGGKGATIIVPQLLTYPGSAFVIDPKGENATITAMWRMTDGAGGHLRWVAILDPFGDVRGDAADFRANFNPLRRLIKSPRMVAEANVLAEALVTGESSHWVKSARQFMAAIILHVVTAEGKKQRDLNEVMRIVGRDPELIAAELSTNRALGGLIRDQALRLPAIPDGELGSIMSSLRSGADCFTDPYIRQVVSDDGLQVHFDQWLTGIMTVYVCLRGSLMERYSPWLRVVTTAALDTLHDAEKPPALPVQFIIDETATLGHFEAIERAAALSAGYGVQLWTTWQTWSQLAEHYKRLADGFWGNAGIRYTFSADTNDTAEYISKGLGTRTVATHSESSSNGGASSSVGQAAAPLLDPAAVSRMPQVPVLHSAVSLSGCKPAYVLLQNYWEIPELTGRWDDPRDAPLVPVELSAVWQNGRDDDDAPGVEQPRRRRPRPKGFGSGKSD